uniref:NADH-ubiquinone oxidoreductase chain 4 n=1 Tax=Tetraphalerus bruchi TaxID=546504 RepID=B6D8Z1_TETBR|nr:NADH dehydrogenase subunit 4 [Tetraphalerus bruchi]ACF35129.1 NADH dehydrogenase subunit 4 [Tetraphalerus bruchi]
MLKMIFFYLFMIPLCFSGFWLFHFFLIFSGACFYLYLKNLSFWFGLSYLFGVDSLSGSLIMLSIWICSLMIIASESVYSSGLYNSLFCFLVLFLLLFLFLTFCSLNLFLFYLFFEGSLIPTLMLIVGWGYQPERLQAGVYLLFYTLLASLPLLVGIFFYYEFSSSLFLALSLPLIESVILYFSMIFAFLVSVPMYLVHLWLPKAHVEAPISGSMILAGVMLKLGGYGMIRVMKLFLISCLEVNFFFVILSLVGSFVVSLICLRQVDLKMLIAYSSVAHMGLVLAGIMSLSMVGFAGSLIIMVAHGLCSSGLFCLANISFDRFNSRSMLLNKGMVNFMPSMTLWWFLLSSSNMAAPPSLNLLGEIFLLSGLMSWSSSLIFLLIFISFFSVLYSLYLYSYSQHGKVFSGLYSCSPGFVREYLLLAMHWLPLNLLFLSSDLFMF